MKKLILLRHGDAAATTLNKEPILTEKGIEQIEKVRDQLIHLDLLPKKILCSPLLRAQQTAQIIQSVAHADFVFEKALADQDVSHVAALIENDPATPLLIVGHAPSIYLLAEHLTIQPLPNQGVKKGGGFLLEFEHDFYSNGDLKAKIQ